MGGLNGQKDEIMDNNVMRILVKYMHDLRSGNWNNNRTGEQPGFDTTTEDDAHWSQGNWSRDGRRSQDQPR